MSLQYVILCSKDFITEKIVKATFSLLRRLSSLRIIRPISGSTKELHKKCFDKNLQAQWNLGILIKKNPVCTCN